MNLDDYPLISDWVTVEDGRIVLRSGKVDIGQRISTALALIAAEELCLDPSGIAIAPVSTDDSPDEGITSGSNSVEQSGRAIRAAAATLRRLAITAAASREGGDPSDWRLEQDGLRGPGQNDPVPLTKIAATLDLDVPVERDVTPIARDGAPPRGRMRGIEALVDGSFVFLHDIEEPRMWHARVVRPPHLVAKLVCLDDDVVRDLQAQGFRVIEDGRFVAVAGPGEWPVIRAAEKLGRAAEWGTGDGIDDGDIFALLTTGNAHRLKIVDGRPMPEAEIPAPLDVIHAEARYERPFTMHGALAPSAALAEWDGTKLRILTHSQGIFPLRNAIAESFGLEPVHVSLTHVPGSGCYGHNGADDAAMEAALIARHLPGRPILLKWTREDEHGWEPYGPPQAVEIAATLGAGERISAISVNSIGGTFRGRPRPGPDRAGPAKLIANWMREGGTAPQPPKPNMNEQGGLHRNIDPIYAIGDRRLVKNLVSDLPLRTSALRCLGAAANVFAIESFIDERCRSSGQDPFAFRKAQILDERAIEVLDVLEEAAGPCREGRGIAYAQYKNSMARVGVAVDLDVTDEADVRLHRIVLVADAGRVADLDGLEAQLEGGALQGASWALEEAVTWDRDGVTSRDWESYPVLRFENVPEFDITIIDRPESPALGAGEAASGPVVAAIANAICDATGLRLRRLPMTGEAIRGAALRA
ncbi:molybdopterin cofactor-binding domain-containing protein [Ovoidimarina sediminis]|uniref:molybdopterin cofactor-binding domain-containing protein n=1 Tax=Ovoidimarina sediminis TaxID=3079856 RepID=UPI0029102E3F|nr:molybdopterin cofactor-binding domain-containing protein [Rhodophyticola sp. MJ-SS7]MDU8944749.1 molybdopterin cofactor-binding domain-containing protein [Rhodophyticola sp. MJ-SS7]